MKMTRTALAIAVSLSLGLSLLAGCKPAPPASPTAAVPDTPFKPTASIKELMESIIDPAADGVWNAVSTETSKKGLIENQPRTDEEWRAVRHHAMVLMEATNLLLMEGRPVAPPGTKSVVKDELEPADVQKLIAANRPAFIAQANALHAVAAQALAAIDAKDPQTLVTVGGNLDAVCEACHLQFWYPHQVIPIYPGGKVSHAVSRAQ